MEKSLPLTEALFYILLATRNPNYGYGIIQEVSDMTEGRVVMGPGTLYGAINSLLDRGYIKLYSEEKDSRKKKEYLITDTGKEAFFMEAARLRELLHNAEKMDCEGKDND